MNSTANAIGTNRKDDKILFVDDEPFVLQGIRRSLFGRFQADTAEGPEEALRKVLNQGPYAVIVSDMRMPGMDGAELLSQIRGLAPDSVRVMLTGYADVDAAMRAVNEGRIFRFLNKPISPEELSETLRNCLEQYHLIRAEKDLLEKTVAGAVHVLSEVLSMANPTAFNKGSRLRQYARHIAGKLQLEDLWEFEIAAMLSELGCVTLPPDLLEARYAGHTLTPEEQERLNKHPSIGHDLIRQIPRLEVVAEMILRQNESVVELSKLAGPKAKSIRMGAQMLRVSLEFDRLLNDGMERKKILETLINSPEKYDSKIVVALSDIVLNSDPMEFREVSISDLRVGMVLKQELRTPGGTLLMARGQEVSFAMLNSMRNFAEKGLLAGRVRVLVPRPTV